MPKRRTTAKKRAATRSSPVKAKKVAASPKKKAAVARRTKTVAADMVAAPRSIPPEVPPAVAEIDQRIIIAQDNLRELTEQAASYSGAADQERASERIAEQEAKLVLLRKQRDALS
jgi:hypothetical protein